MKKKLSILVSTFAACMAMNAAVNMIVVKENGEVLKFDGENIEEVIFEKDDNTSPLEFEVISDNSAKVIEGDYKDLETIEIPEKVKIEGKEYTVTSIGSYAFWDLKNLKNVTIPESVTNIESGAFFGCGFSSITIPESVQNISSGAFAGCYNFEPGLLIYANGTKCYGWLGPEELCTEVVIPDGVKEIGDQAFYKSFYGLTSITFPEGLESIGEMAFADCDALTTAELPSSLTSLGYGAFMYCNNLNLTIKASKTNVKLDKYAIDYCKSVTWAE